MSRHASNPAPVANGQSEHSTIPLEIIETDLLAANRLREGEISGYFLARFVVALNPVPSEFSAVTVESIFVDSFHSLVSASSVFGEELGDAIDVTQISLEIRNLVNKRIGFDRIHSVFITQVDHLKRNEVRTNSAARRATIRGEIAGEPGPSIVSRPAE
ncbi:MAG: hypothetical protein AB3N20_14535 [Rhizobiaceae bacterium]